ncbi:MAG: cbb3-type cytochrome c oxidase subunit I [Nitrospiraceae bacterium]|nr:cbb3-type cytochrome c oxidase subunit I [Nitrospiraceae bacterium]
MDRFARWFIIMSIVYFGIAAVLGICMLFSDKAMAFKFVHSHLNLLGWVSMMIYGVGYHILPRFMGRPLYSQKLGDIQFWAANIGLVVMLFFYMLNVYQPSGAYVALTVIGGILEFVSIVLFFYNMMKTLLPKAQA